MLFLNRTEAGMKLSSALSAYRNQTDVMVLGLPRGGVPVAAEIARGLGAPFDVFIVRKLGTPGREELGMGAIASGGVRVLNQDIIDHYRISAQTLEEITWQEEQELARREQLYREGRPLPDVRGKCVILADDGLATGSTMKAAVSALRQLEPARIIVAVPIASGLSREELRAMVEEVVCLSTPEPFYSVGAWYEDFTQTTDEEVQAFTRSAQKQTT